MGEAKPTSRDKRTQMYDPQAGMDYSHPGSSKCINWTSFVVTICDVCHWIVQYIAVLVDREREQQKSIVPEGRKWSVPL